MTDFDSPDPLSSSKSEHPGHSPAVDGDRSGLRAVPTIIKLMVALSGLLVLLLVYVNVIGSRQREERAKDADVSGLKAQTAALKNQLNQQRLALGLQPLDDGSESVEMIANRLKKDAETMVGMAKSFQTMLAEKDAEGFAQSGKLLQSEQVRQALAQEVSRLKLELEKAHLAGRGNEELMAEISQIKKERDALQAELSQAKTSSRGGADAEELQRRLEETQRAKDFFEAKVRQLEAEASGAH